MKIKWKCVFINVILPIIIGILIFIGGVSLINFMVSSTPPINDTWTSNTSLTSTQSKMAAVGSGINPIPIIFGIVIIGAMFTFFIESLKPCIINERTTIIDHISSGISTIADLMRFVVCLSLIVGGIVCIPLAFIISPGFLIYSISCFIFAYFIYPKSDNVVN